MSRSVVLLGSVLVALGALLFAWKAGVHEMPVLPSEAENVWRVELELAARAEGTRGSARIQLPDSGPGQAVFDEQVNPGGLLFDVRETDEERLGIWRGWAPGVHHLSYAFRVQLTRRGTGRPPQTDPPEDPALLAAGPGLPVTAPEIEEQLDRLQSDEDASPPALLRRIFAFVADETETVRTGSSDALLTLTAREGNATGQARLLATLLRAAGIPARLAAGLRLRQPRIDREVVYVEAHVEGRWETLFPSLGLLGSTPTDLVALRRDGAELVTSVGLGALDYRYHVSREQLEPEELTALMLPTNRLLSAISLYRLPVTTQDALRVLLVLPLATLLVAVYRNVIGLPTFGTFLPILVPFSLRDSGLAVGMAMVAGVLGAGIISRLLLDRFRLLFVPRLCVLLCIVVLLLAGMALAGYELQSHDILSGVLLPIVILTMLIERFSITVAEEGAQQAVTRLASTSVVMFAAYPLFRADAIAQIMFGFPELVLCAMGLLVFIGGYTGYRLSEVVRFRTIAALSDGVDP